jgi:hypothetical protein
MGPTNSGKSAIIRAIKWCLFNKPSGKRFIKKGESEAKVSAFFDDGLIITKVRGATKHYYEIANDKVSSQPVHLEGFGTGPVKEVLDAHGMQLDKLGNEEDILNICDQFSPPFFLTESSSDRAAAIGKLANTDVIDTAIKNVTGEIRESNAALRELKSLISTVDDELIHLADITFMEKDLINISDAKFKIEKDIRMIDKINSICSKLQIFNTQKESLKRIISREQEIDELITNVESMMVFQNKIANITKLNNSAIASNNTRIRLEKIIENIDFDEVEETISNLDSTIGKLRTLSSIRALNNKLNTNQKKLFNLENAVSHDVEVEEVILILEDCKAKFLRLKNIKEANRSLQNNIDRQTKGNSVISGLEASYNDKIKEYKQELLKNPVCPICQSEVTQDKINQIKDIL